MRKKTEESQSWSGVACGRIARLWRKLNAGDAEGGALLETAVALPVFLMLLTGIFSFGAAYSNKMALANGVGVAWQRLQQLRTTTTDPCKDTLAALAAAAPGLDPTKLQLSLTLAGVSNPYTTSTCSGAQSYLTTGSTFTVKATYPCHLSVLGYSYGSSCQLAAAVSEYEY
jgi:Flp pilus assembly protein TadG